MSNTNAKLKLDGDDCDMMLDGIVDSDPRCEEALKEYEKTLESLRKKNLTKDVLDIDAAVNYREVTIQEAIYKKAFHDGMRFILNTMNGKEVIEI